MYIAVTVIRRKKKIEEDEEDTPGNEAELELECLSNSSPAPGVCVSRNNKAVVQQGFRKLFNTALHVAVVTIASIFFYLVFHHSIK